MSWSFLAVLTVGTAPLPAFLITGLALSIGGLTGLVLCAPRLCKAQKIQPTLLSSWPYFWIATLGLFGNHAFYFFALRLAPPAEAGLFNYVWPLLIVLFSSVLLGQKLRLSHLLGLMLGIGALVLVVFSEGSLALSKQHINGYLLAFGAGLTWALYSLLSARFPAISSSNLALPCLISGLMSLACHTLFEQPAWPSSATQWLFIALLGIAPMGAAFYLWDFAMKHGNVKLVGTLAYAMPVMSTGILIAFGRSAFGWHLALAASMVALAAYVASKE